MKTFTRSFDGTGTDTWTLPGGTYLRILSAASAITVKVLRQGQEKAYFENVTAGVAWLSEDENGKLATFDSVEITCSTIQSVTMAIGYGQLFDDATSGSVTATLVLGSTISTGSVSVTTAATLVLAADSTAVSVTVYNNDSTNTLYIGASNAVTTSTGIPVPPKSERTIDKAPKAAIYGISSAGTIDARYLKEAA